MGQPVQLHSAPSSLSLLAVGVLLIYRTLLHMHITLCITAAPIPLPGTTLHSLDQRSAALQLIYNSTADIRTVCSAHPSCAKGRFVNTAHCNQRGPPMNRVQQKHHNFARSGGTLSPSNKFQVIKLPFPRQCPSALDSSLNKVAAMDV